MPNFCHRADKDCPCNNGWERSIEPTLPSGGEIRVTACDIWSIGLNVYDHDGGQDIACTLIADEARELAAHLNAAADALYGGAS